MIIEPYTNMMVNFGSTMADYSFHKDENGDRALLKGMLDGSI